LVCEIALPLRNALRSRRIVLGRSAHPPYLALRSDGAFVHVDEADQEDVLDPLQVVRVNPNLNALLAHVEDELRDGGEASAARLVNATRRSIEAARHIGEP